MIDKLNFMQAPDMPGNDCQSQQHMPNGSGVVEPGESSTVERILVAAQAEFMNKGFGGARTTVIAEKAGVTAAMLHYYFGTKKSLFERIIAEKVKDIRELVINALSRRDLELFERLKAAISEHLDFLARNPDLPRFLLMEMYTDRERMQPLLNRFGETAASLIAELQSEIDSYHSRGQCRKVDAKMLVLDMISLNMFTFIAAPIVGVIMGEDLDNLDNYIAMRKKENIETIMLRLKI